MSPHSQTSSIDLARAQARAQPGIFGAPLSHALSLEFHCASDDASRLRALLGALDFSGPGARLVAGLGARLAGRLGLAPRGLRELGPVGTVPQGFVASPYALWLLVPGSSSGGAYAAAQELIALLAPDFTLCESTGLYRYRDGRDLSGFRDGTENPQGDAARDAALLQDPGYCGGSFVLVQRFRHALAEFARLPVGQQSLVIGRERESDEEIAAAPASAHVRRTAQESFTPEAFLWRRSMPWGTPLRQGLQFIAFMADLDRADQMLRRMAGLEDGIADALLRYTRSETGAYYYCPPLAAERLVLDPL